MTLTVVAMTGMIVGTRAQICEFFQGVGVGEGELGDGSPAQGFQMRAAG